MSSGGSRGLRKTRACSLSAWSLLAQRLFCAEPPDSIPREECGERKCLRSHFSPCHHSCRTERKRTGSRSQEAKLNRDQEIQTRASFPKEMRETLSVEKIEPSAF